MNPIPASRTDSFNEFLFDLVNSLEEDPLHLAEALDGSFFQEIPETPPPSASSTTSKVEELHPSELICKDCNKTLPDRRSFANHRRQHERFYFCPAECLTGRQVKGWRYLPRYLKHINRCKNLTSEQRLEILEQWKEASPKKMSKVKVRSKKD